MIPLTTASATEGRKSALGNSQGASRKDPTASPMLSSTVRDTKAEAQLSSEAPSAAYRMEVQ